MLSTVTSTTKNIYVMIHWWWIMVYNSVLFINSLKINLILNLLWQIFCSRNICVFSFFFPSKQNHSIKSKTNSPLCKAGTMFYTDVIVRYDLLYCRYPCPSFIKMSVFATMYCRLGYNVRIRCTVSVRVRTKCMLFAIFPTLVRYVLNQNAFLPLRIETRVV